MMDEICGYENFQAEIVGQRTLGHHLALGMDVRTDYILWYSKTNDFVYNQQYQSLSEEEFKEKFPFHEKLEQTSFSRITFGETSK
jgi:adenine specific DNA methylase Mod